MLVPKNQHKPSSLPAQKKNPNTAVARANPVKNAKVTNAGAAVHTALAGAVLQPLP
ncbi:hypothetical protein [Chryseobacterium shandongense]|jgi:hypothetical protein|uniref:hypothetical protein n=1 Tax=Chryseobacterium shandongense TaxID=1493872 RepID=UPI0013DE36B0|nr:hypothetical protein [Chryseobacterium shandongense]